MEDNTFNDNIYVNSTRVSMSIYDFTFYLMHTIPLINQKGKIENSSILSSYAMSMSPQHAKAMFLALKNQIDKFEKKYGEIKISEENLEYSDEKENSDAK